MQMAYPQISVLLPAEGKAVRQDIGWDGDLKGLVGNLCIAYGVERIRGHRYIYIVQAKYQLTLLTLHLIYSKRMVPR